ncbi:hypothetical protein GOL94_27410 [Sinorhizobium medicae]|nr:hypothetical protein [Sinorhizobium medicae]MDX1201063.1 hypothetical protein [Sinorhizobium medicae]
MRILLAALVGFFFSAAAMAADECRAILAQGIMNASTETRKSQSSESDRAYYCSATLNEARTFYDKQDKDFGSSGGGASISYGPFGGGVNTSQTDVNSSSLTEETYNKWKNDNCSEQEKDRAQQAFEFQAQSWVAVSIVDAWRDCKLNVDGLSCWTEPETDGAVLLNVVWRKLTNSVTTVLNSFLKGGESVWDGTPKGRIFPTNMTLPKGHVQVAVLRPGADSVRASLNVTNDGEAHSCAVYVSAKPPAPAPPAKEENIFGQFTCKAPSDCKWWDVLQTDKKPPWMPDVSAGRFTPNYEVQVSPAIRPLPEERLKVFQGEQRYNVTVTPVQ